MGGDTQETRAKDQRTGLPAAGWRSSSAWSSSNDCKTWLADLCIIGHCIPQFHGLDISPSFDCIKRIIHKSTRLFLTRIYPYRFLLGTCAKSTEFISTRLSCFILRK
ncbi:hypothetical protein BS78_10G011700 [Paspalum vaginatum]|nr:hypothetical protein BS78_10G011700 [Paspalum vaginatum]